MSVYFESDEATVHHGDCLDVLATLPDASVDAVVTDPPYGLANTDPAHVAETITRWVNGERDYLPGGRGFMGKEWDAFVPPVAVWDECMRVLKPGGHALVFAGSRTVDLMTLGLRLAGFEIRDSIAWLYGSGFPKSMDVSAAIDKVRDDVDDVRVVCRWLRARIDEHPRLTTGIIGGIFGFHPRMVEHWAARDTDSQPSLPTLEQWDRLRELLGFDDGMDSEVLRLNLRKGEPGEAWAGREVVGTVDEWKDRTNYALTSRDGLRRGKSKNPAAEAWEGWGTALKPAFEPIVVARKPLAGTVAANVLAHGTGAINIDATRIATTDALKGSGQPPLAHGGQNARPFHASHVAVATERHEGGRHPANVVLDESQAAALDQQSGTLTSGMMRAGTARAPRDGAVYGKLEGDATSRDTFGDSGGASRFFYTAKAGADERPNVDGVQHPTVKPLDLMRWLVRLVTPRGGVVLEPFAGSGTTVEAAVSEGFRCIAVEREAEYLPLIESRLVKPIAQSLFGDWGQDGAA